MRLQTIQINFARTGFAASSKSALLLITGLILLILSAFFYGASENKANDAAEKKAAQERKMGVYSTSKGTSNHGHPAAETIASAVDRPWFSLLDDLEGAIDDSIDLLRIEPDINTREITLAGQSNDIEHVLKFIDRLDKAPSLRNTRLTGQSTRKINNESMTEFVIVATWVNTR